VVSVVFVLVVVAVIDEKFVDFIIFICSMIDGHLEEEADDDDDDDDHLS
jgi:hypothetical protein